ncbi:MAG: hypothetical protein ABL999_01410 [Pyrinomonadaceae bacterium]
MTAREKVVSDLKMLTDEQINMVAVYLKSLKLRKRTKLPRTNGNPATDSIFTIGKDPVAVGVTDASENLDKYLY